MESSFFIIPLLNGPISKVPFTSVSLDAILSNLPSISSLLFSSKFNFSSAKTWTKVSILSLIYLIKLSSSFFVKFNLLSLSTVSKKLSLDLDEDYFLI